MSRAYIYMECPETGETVTLGRLTLAGSTGTFCSGLLIPDTDLGENLRRERGV